MNGNLNAVLFDFDGTLAPNLNLPDMRRQVIDLTLSLGVPEQVFADEHIVEIITAAQRYLAQQSADTADRYAADAHALIRQIEMDAAASQEVFDITRPTLAQLREQGIRTAIVTRNCRAAVELTFPDWAEHTDGLFARDQVDHLKPDPRHFSAALTHLSSPAPRAAIVSDGAMDMRTGRALDMRCLGVLTGSNDAEALTEAGAHSVFDTIASIRAI